jgi:uncharacterized protein YnzC (UPF0291/DUF896 family)
MSSWCGQHQPCLYKNNTMSYAQINIINEYIYQKYTEWTTLKRTESFRQQLLRITFVSMTGSNRKQQIKLPKILVRIGDRGGTVVKALRYKSEGRWFASRWCHWNF